MPRYDPIPSKDLVLLNFAQTFLALITATPSLYGLLASDATSLGALVSDFATRLATALAEGTATKVARTAKNTSKKALVARLRQLARRIKAFPSLTPAQIEELGLRPNDHEPTPTPVPPTRPVVQLEAIGGAQVAVRLHDELTPTSRAKPDYGQGAYLWGKIGDTAPASPDDCKFLGTITRTRHVLDRPSADVNKTIWIIAQWVNDKGETGPTSIPASSSIAA